METLEKAAQKCAYDTGEGYENPNFNQAVECFVRGSVFGFENGAKHTKEEYKEKLRWIPVHEKEPECFENEEDGIYYSKYLELKVNGYEYPLIGYYVYANDDQFFYIISEKDDEIKQEDITHFRECFL